MYKRKEKGKKITIASIQYGSPAVAAAAAALRPIEIETINLKRRQLTYPTRPFEHVLFGV